MFETIEKLREKPESSKKKIAFLTAFFVAGIIFVVWLSVVYPDLKMKNSKEKEVLKTEPSPLSAFEDTLSNGFLGLGEQLKNLKNSALLFSTKPEYFQATVTPDTTVSSASTTP